MRPLLLTLAFLLSGGAGLIYETVFARHLVLTLGTRGEAFSIVLGAFMAGLALGAALGGRGTTSPRQALRRYAACEAGGAACAGVLALLLPHLPPIYAALAGVLGSGRLWRVLLLGGLLVPPAACLGATLPIVVQVPPDPPSRRGAAGWVAWLYAVNTTGGVGGALATAFLLLPRLGLRGTTLAGAALSLLAGGVALGLSRGAETAAVDGPAPPPGPPAPAPLLVAAALSGAVALGLEVLWSRTLMLTVGSSTQAMALVLATFLGGLAGGSLLYAHHAGRTAAPTWVAARLLLLAALLSILVLGLATSLPFFYLLFWPGLGQSAAGWVLLRLGPALSLMLLPTLVLGAVLPALVHACLPDRAHGPRTGAAVGAVYAANTAGAILGPVGVGLWALPALGVPRAAALLGGLEIAAALAALWAGWRGPRPGRWGWAGLGLLLLLAGAAVARPPAWDPRIMGTGLAYRAPKMAALLRAGQLRDTTASFRVRYYRDGAEASVLVYDGGPGTHQALVLSGRHEATTDPYDMRSQYLLGHLPALLHEGPVRDGLVIGLGSGMTAGCLAQHGAAVTVVELTREVPGAAALFSPWNHDALRDPRVKLVLDDGRHFLLAGTGQYDVITVDPIHPSVPGSEALYSLEQYRLVRRRLRPGGVAAQWLPLSFMPAEAARTLAATFLAVFPDAQAWIDGYDVLLIGGAGDGVPAARMAAALARPQIAASLARIRHQRLATLVGEYALGPAELARYAAGARLSTDDRPVVEFTLPWQMDAHTVDENLLAILRARPARLPLRGDLAPAVLNEIAQAEAAVALDQQAIAQRAAGHYEPALQLFEAAMARYPDDPLANQAVGR